VEVDNIAGAEVRGLKVDGEGKVDELVHLRGFCPRLRLADLDLRGFRRCAVRATNLVGDPDPVTLSHLRVFGGLKGGVGVRLESKGGTCRYITLSNSRFDGPGDSALLLGGEFADVQFSQNRVFGLEAVVRYQSGPRPPSTHMKLTNCTAYQAGALLSLRVPPNVEAFGPWLVEHNLLLSTRAALLVGGKAPGVAAFLVRPAWNGADDVTIPGAGLLGCVRLDVRDVDTHPDNDRLFLRYLKGSKLFKAAPGGKPVGVRPFELGTDAP
jgi:hypothetical protein